MLAVDQAASLLNRSGISTVTHVASGMEGHVFDIGDELVAKVWFAKRRDEIVDLRAFNALLESLALPFGTPFITDVIETEGAIVSIERRLTGTPLSELVTFEETSPPAFAVEAMISILRALRDRPVRSVAQLPILGIKPSPTASNPLLEVVQVRLDRYGDQLAKSVLDWDWVSDRTLALVRNLPGSDRCVVHGDLCPPNILMRPDLTVSAVVDWGFLSHIGDPAFEVSITSAFYNMYGPHHRVIDETLLAAFIRQFGDERQTLLIYRALYAMLTSNAYSEDGADGHYEWCVTMLNREDVREALSSSPSS